MVEAHFQGNLILPSDLLKKKHSFETYKPPIGQMRSAENLVLKKRFANEYREIEFQATNFTTLGIAYEAAMNIHEVITPRAST